jgi:hypothetical protein
MDNMNYQSFWKFIKLLHDNDLLQHVELIGSWCEYLYAQSGALKGFDANIRTLDIDFLVKNMRRPTKKVSLSAIASQSGYTIDKDVLTGTTKIYTPDLMEIEFLIEQKGAAKEPVLDTNIGVSAQALHHVSILKTYSMQIDMFGMSITVPTPEAYAIHKIIINGQRGNKIEKDLRAIENILPYLDTEQMGVIIASLTKREKKIVEEYLEAH